jgi:hypothetical protein
MAVMSAGAYPVMKEALPQVRHEAETAFLFGLDLA